MSEDAARMEKALALAERGRATTSPNPMVGALVVDADGVVVGRGAHLRAGGPHAEVHALADAGWRARGATLYCTLEPCSHTGKTGPCAPQVIAAGIRRAVIAMEDPNPQVQGRGLAMLTAAGIEVRVGVLAEAAARLNGPFLSVIQRARPFVTLKAALSADGRVSAAPGMATRLTSAPADRRVHRDRAEVDALAVGSETLLVDDPLLTPRGAWRGRPLTRVVFDRRLRTSPSCRLLSTLSAGPVIIVTATTTDAEHRGRAARLTAAGAMVEGVPSETFLAAALSRLAGLGLSSIIVEGGPALQQACWDAGVADRVQLYMTARVAGPAGVPWLPLTAADLATLSEVEVRALGPDVLVQADVHRAD